jgi:hypothetical protein
MRKAVSRGLGDSMSGMRGAYAGSEGHQEVKACGIA